jgi:hypothetical protein
MSTAKMLKAEYDHVVSEGVIEPALRLLSMGGRSADLNSLVLSGTTHQDLSLMSIIGLGKDVWADEDATEYVKRLRSEW